MFFTSMIAVYAFPVLLALSILKAFFRSIKRISLPPGPRGLPLVGNLLDMPVEREWLTFARWGEVWGTLVFQSALLAIYAQSLYLFLGDICSVTVLGQPIIIINSAEVACDMLDKKSAIYSDRPVLQMAGELVGWKHTLVLLPYGDRFRRYRRLFHNLIGSQAVVKRFFPGEELEARRFLRRVLMKPDDLAAHVRK
jgi:hypothetical protein